MIRAGLATEMLRRMSTSPAASDWYAVPGEKLSFSPKPGARPFILCRPALGPIATGFVRTRKIDHAQRTGPLPGSTATLCRTPHGPGILHPAHQPRHEQRCGLADLGLVPLWHIASVAVSLLDANTRRCREPDHAVVQALRGRLAPGGTSRDHQR